MLPCPAPLYIGAAASSRHKVWAEVTRVLGNYHTELSQQVTAGSEVGMVCSLAVVNRKVPFKIEQ